MGWREVRGVRLTMERGEGMTASHRLVMYALADAADQDTLRCFPSLATLVKWTWLGKSTLARALLDLEAAGLVTREQRTTGRGHESTVYRMNRDVSWRDKVVPERDKGLSQSETRVVPERDTKGPVKGPEERTIEEEPHKPLAEPTPDGPGAPHAQGPVFLHWLKVMNKSGAAGKTTTAAGKKRMRLIASRLKEGYTSSQLITAIDNCAASEWHMGNGQTDLTLILRADKLDGFIDRGKDQGKGGSGRGRLPDAARISEAWGATEAQKLPWRTLPTPTGPDEYDPELDRLFGIETKDGMK